MRENSSSEVNAAIHDALFLLLLEDTRDDGLGSHSVASVVHHHGAQGVKAGSIYRAVNANALKVVALYKRRFINKSKRKMLLKLGKILF